ncbi:glycosyltransferase family 2 protein [Loktanella sp. DJP18]|uniref:glycosyltransferase family 2 protein n=1 Tax=Loktanella sp. DJP18 TaxID=3409788 RepID=UPI003BB72B17
MSSFSVLVPVLNGAEHIGDALNSVANQTHGNLRVVVSDNASTDATLELLDSWRDRLDLKVIRQPETRPMQEHFNAILDQVRTDHYMLLCHDDYLAQPDAVALADQALIDHPDIPAVYCDLEYVNADKRRLATRRFPRGALFAADTAGRETLRTARNMFGVPIGVRRSALGDLRYDPRFHYTMDVDLSWAMARGQMLVHIAQPLIANRYRAGNTTWQLLNKSRGEFLALHDKYGIPLNPVEHVQLSARIWAVNQQKKIFGLFGRMFEWLG